MNEITLLKTVQAQLNLEGTLQRVGKTLDNTLANVNAATANLLRTRRQAPQPNVTEVPEDNGHEDQGLTIDPAESL